MKVLIAIVATTMPGWAFAQPFSESMMDCAALYQNAAQWVQTDEKADKLIYAANQWADAALVQTNAEGKPISKDALWSNIDAKTDAWEARGAVFVFSQDFRDWAAYCRAFAKDRGITIDK